MAQSDGSGYSGFPPVTREYVFGSAAAMRSSAAAARSPGRRPSGIFASNHRYSADTYEESTGATLAELRDAPGTVTRRLLGPLLRSLDSEEVFAKALTDDE
ncbi:hypothetical protein [Streptomyces sp. NRRL S-378]|uniref:hypothetical protein n=1 Tax=Streptomyces sp. NRRL S-378 TaxID=1463904 RepID=UPI0004C4EDBE|nr:hypothetical protein [Streptomyces sp. NRRL S-378]